MPELGIWLIAREVDMLKELRKARRLSQSALAERAKIHDSYVSQIESGERTPSVPVLHRLLRALDANEQQRSQALAHFASNRSAA